MVYRKPFHEAGRQSALSRRWAPVTGIVEILAVEQVDRDVFRGHPVPTRMVRTFGGQVAGQALVAAVRTVDASLPVHSLHGYFLRPGDPTRPTVLLVDRLRDGRSFTTRRVSAVQAGEAIFSMSASFTAGDPGPAHADSMPDVPGPDDLVDPGSSELPMDVALRTEWPEWDVRAVALPGAPASQQGMWVRYRHRLPDDPSLHACALTYLSDMKLLGAAMLPHLGDGEHPAGRLQIASLDHALWFLRPFRTDEWLYYEQTSPSAGSGRGLAQGRIFDGSGVLVATVVQEGMMRDRR